MMKQPAHNQVSTKPASMPSFAWIALTNNCNLNCAHCQRALLKKQGLLQLQEMSPKILTRLESEVFPYLKRVQFGGNNFGEQLAASMWDEVFTGVSRFKLAISIVTNGTLLNTARIKSMVAAGVEFNFSLEGASKESYEAARGYRFNKFFETLKKTCEEKSRRPDKGARVNLGFTIYRDNIRELIDLIQMASRIGVDRIVVTHFIPWHESQRRQSLVYHQELCDQVLAKAKIVASELGIRVDLPAPFAANDSQEKPDQPERGLPKPCYHPWRSFSINEKGDVMPCCATSVVMGNLEKAGFDQIWHGSKYRRLRKTVNSSRPLVFCRDCAFREIEVHSTEPISFWSDEAYLLAAIGPEQRKDSSSLTLRKIKKRLRGSRWSSKALPYLIELYRRHGAFYVTDIYAICMIPLFKRLSRKR